MHQTFHWTECAAVLGELCAEAAFVLDGDGQTFLGPGLRVRIPQVFPIPSDLIPTSYGKATAQELAARRSGPAHQRDPLAKILASLPPHPPNQCLVLMQAGAVSIGYFEAGEAVATKTMKRYVVRGRGRAQAAFLRTKGKSRYGSRLRLQNAVRLLNDTNLKLTEYWQRFGAPAQIFVAAPARLWSDLFRVKSDPPFDRDQEVDAIPLDIPEPTTEVLLRSYKSLCYGRIERP